MRWLSCACFVLSMLAAGAHAADSSTVEIAVIPYLPTRALLGYYEPLRAHLQAKWKRPVLIVTAPGFRTFAERTARRQYPFIVTALHYARLAEVEAGYQPLLAPRDPLQGLLVVRRDGRVHHVDELKGKRIVTVNRTTLISIMAESFLRGHGLDVARDITMVEASVGGHHNAIAALLG